MITFENRLVLVISLSLDEMAGNDNGYLICKMAAFKPLKSLCQEYPRVSNLVGRLRPFITFG